MQDAFNYFLTNFSEVIILFLFIIIFSIILFSIILVIR